VKQELNQKDVHVDVDKGIVTLRGKVRTETERRNVDELARSTPGVVAVMNKLEVKIPSAAYPPSTLPSAPVTTRVTVIPIYTTPPPKVVTAVPVVTLPPPVIVPDYPKLKIQAYSGDDMALANRIARRFRPEGLTSSSLEDVTITVRGGYVIVTGFTLSREAHETLIASLQAAGGMTAIYDQSQTR
jgi:osmotically-inducible protein OsmY